MVNDLTKVVIYLPSTRIQVTEVDVYPSLLYSTAKGIEHFKAGEYDTAMKYLGHALQIDSDNIEALVARGAL